MKKEMIEGSRGRERKLEKESLESKFQVILFFRLKVKESWKVLLMVFIEKDSEELR